LDINVTGKQAHWIKYRTCFFKKKGETLVKTEDSRCTTDNTPRDRILDKDIRNIRDVRDVVRRMPESGDEHGEIV